MNRTSEFWINTTPRHAALVGRDATFAAVTSARRRPGGWLAGDLGAGVGRGSRGDERGRLTGAEGRDRARAAA
jgi:hypothetical protein